MLVFAPELSSPHWRGVQSSQYIELLCHLSQFVEVAATRQWQRKPKCWTEAHQEVEEQAQELCVCMVRQTLKTRMKEQCPITYKL